MRRSVLKGSAVFGITVFMFVGCASQSRKTDQAVSAKPSTTTPAAASPQATATPIPPKLDHVMCKKDKDERTLHIVEKPKGCALEYTKYGNKNIAAESVISAQHCNDVKSRIISNLEKAGFTCPK